MNVEIINNLIKSVKSVVAASGVCDNMIAGKPGIVNSPVSEEPVCILVGTTGDLRGQVILSFTKENALNISNIMQMGYGSGEFDTMAKSALQELGNMIMGTFSTLLSNDNIIIDITPPTLIEAEGIQFSGNVGIKFEISGCNIGMFVNIMIKE